MMFNKIFKKGKPTILCLILLIVIVLLACSPTPPPFECPDPVGCTTILPGESIRLAVLQVLSGDLESIGLEQLRSVEIAIADRNGEFLGHPIELQAEDALCSPEGGTSAALKVVTLPRVAAIIGTTCSNSAVKAAEIMSKEGLVMVSSSNTAPSLTSIGGQQGSDWHPGYFRTAHNDIIQGRAAATYVFEELNITKVATLNDGDAYTQGLTDVFKQVFTELGGEIVLTLAINKGDRDMHPALNAVADSEAELLFFPIFPPESNYITTQVKDVKGLETIKLMVTEGSLQDFFIEAVGQSGQGIYLVGPDTPTGLAYNNFVAKYQKQYGEKPITPFHAHTYDTTNLVIKALEEVTIQEDDGSLHIPRQALREALYQTADFEGLIGTLNCDSFGDCGASKFKVLRLDNPEAGLDGLNLIYTYTPK